jgi:hypothetical protein
MNKVIDSIIVNNPCAKNDGLPQGGTSAVKDYSRAAEQERSGKFDLEEGIQAALASFTQPDWTIESMSDLSQSCDQLLQAGGVRRNPNNLKMGGQTTTQPSQY